MTRELVENENLPISPDGLVRLRPDLAGDLREAATLLDNEIQRDALDEDGQQVSNRTDGVLEARFVASQGIDEQRHLFLMVPKGTNDNELGIKRWAKMPISYGSFVQIEKLLKEAWGDVRNLELALSEIRTN